METLGYGLQIVTITVFFTTDKKYSLHDHHLHYKWHEGNMKVKILAGGLKKEINSRIHFYLVETSGM